MPNETRQETMERTLMELASLGRVGYREEYPEVFDPSYYWWKDPQYGVPENLQSKLNTYDRASCAERIEYLSAQAGMYEEMKGQFSGAESTYIRWMLDNKIKEVYHQINRERESNREGYRQMLTTYAKAQTEAGDIEGAQKTLELAAKKIGGEIPPYEAEPPPMPSWLGEYLESSIPYKKEDVTEQAKQRRSFNQEELTPSLRPLGAQAELNPEQMGLMAGYQAWGKAGAPSRYSEQALLEMSQWERWWEPYVSLSKKLFPKQTALGTRWMTARQR